ncbi:alpha/beta hydrolase [Sphingobium sp. CR2-8]|uniref:alpha/beta fold hydrolase n=1 Tax=Sphingobium sp. CR2-8 TaxID=1306534 RepID=UPI002DB7DAC9|nr:alpha/beta hydrolase [Sphingobium sp. CR2-8]MEC3911447.1 alpha/beta hydrolase [Sphingobium sp. CR2-8]
MTIRRAFLDLPDGQIHYRQAGDGPPMLLLHPSPGSSRQMVGLIDALKGDFRLIAPDTAGNGDSTPLAIPQPDIADYAARLPFLLDALGLDRVVAYGSHTGAAIACDLAILHPDRVSHVVLDGIGLWSPEEQAELLERYATPFTPDVEGAYLMRAFHFCRDQYLFYPWYDRSAAARRDGGVRPAPDLHAWFVEVLKAAETYHLAYRAAFSWDAAGRLTQVPCPALLMAAQDDPLCAMTRAAADLLPDGRFAPLPHFGAPDFSAVRAAAITRFSKD